MGKENPDTRTEGVFTVKQSRHSLSQRPRFPSVPRPDVDPRGRVIADWGPSRELEILRVKN